MTQSLRGAQRFGLNRFSSRAFWRKVVPSLLGLWILASLLVHPLSHDASDRAGAPLLPGSEVTPRVASILGRACSNCHSEKTTWPWYSRVAPVSWLVEDDVRRARARMNLSRWDRIDPADQRLLLTAIATVIENREMPPHRYVALHPEAVLTPDDAVAVIEWAHVERRRIRTSTTSSK